MPADKLGTRHVALHVSTRGVQYLDNSAKMQSHSLPPWGEVEHLTKNGCLDQHEMLGLGCVSAFTQHPTSPRSRRRGIDRRTKSQPPHLLFTPRSFLPSFLSSTTRRAHQVLGKLLTPPSTNHAATTQPSPCLPRPSPASHPCPPLSQHSYGRGGTRTARQRRCPLLLSRAVQRASWRLSARERRQGGQDNMKICRRSSLPNRPAGYSSWALGRCKSRLAFGPQS
ncbi:hypothetical protein BDY17DRAFT_75495 [Neohortaea acidophila]|uniref:Uncharacterized protein n=1 Tax=Neohortaea acidophila TaxID=245834 RepID=A0A6A6Q2V4_9PEZI|nr:uncharacterized protein BDY17DRAFT_75495 [Neohortaea acidophila]KAF2486339.1 hypothetical protein BDY17DRAFT_75495 [Neohortaea acidophila]